MNFTTLKLLICLGLSCFSLSAALTDHLVFIGNTPHDPAQAQQGVFSLRLDRTTGELSAPILAAAAATTPSFLALSSDRKQLYANVVLDEPVNGMTAGVSAFTINAKTGTLDLINTEPTYGNVVAHLVVDQTDRALLLANYSSGSVVSFPLREDGGLSPLKSLITLSGASGVVPARQKTPCPHAVVLAPDNRYLFVPALGQDRTLKFKLNADSATIELADSAAHQAAPGAGPRHAKFSIDGKFYYGLNELNGTVDVSAYDATDGTLAPIQMVSTLPSDFTGTNTAGEIRVHPNGHFVYTSNRGHDSIAVFVRDTGSGRLTLVENEPSGGRWPRNFALSPDGKWLLAANHDSHNLVVFAVDQATGRLKPTGSEVHLDRPFCVLFWN